MSNLKNEVEIMNNTVKYDVLTSSFCSFVQSDSQYFWQRVREQFPILNNLKEPLAYLDSAASTQSPVQVITALTDYYLENRANIHRGVYRLSERSTLGYEKARDKVQGFINSPNRNCVSFTSGTTESLNIVAESFLKSRIQAGQVIMTTIMDHHANFIPWQRVAQKFGAQFVVVPQTKEGELDLDFVRKNICKNVALFAFSHVSNVLGTINPVQEICDLARQHNVITVVDGAQAVAHVPVDVSQFGCDFYAFSGHKIYAPYGIGVLYVAPQWHKYLEPYQVGGGIVERVTIEESTYQSMPTLLEAGTPSIGDAIALGVAIDFVQAIGIERLYKHEQELVSYTLSRLKTIKKLTLYGYPQERVGVFSFALENIHPHDIASFLSAKNIAIRPGHSCAMPLMQDLQVNALTRASFGCYTIKSDIDALIEGILYTQKKML